MSDEFSWFRKALKADVEGTKPPAISADAPQSGFFFKKASKAGGRVPVRIHLDKNGELVAFVGTKEAHRIEDAAKVWTWVAENRKSRDDYVFAWTNGKWPDGTPTEAPADLAKEMAESATTAASAPAMGHNLPTDPFERLMAEVSDKMSTAKGFIEQMAATTAQKTQADKARNIEAELLGLRKMADGLHEVEKRPLIDATKKVDDKFRFRETITQLARQLKTLYENFAIREEARLREEAKKKHEAALAAAEAERKRLAAEREKQMRDDPIAALTTPEPELPVLPLAPEPVKVNVGGGVGRAAGLKTVWTPRIDDWKAAAAELVAKDDPDIRAAVEKKIAAIARALKEQTKIAGVTMVEGRKAA